MTVQGWSQIVVYAVVLLALAYPLGVWMAHVYSRARGVVDAAVRRVGGGQLSMTCVSWSRWYWPSSKNGAIPYAAGQIPVSKPRQSEGSSLTLT